MPITRKRPENEAKDVLAQLSSNAPINKRATVMKATGDGEPLGGGISRPTSKELDQINQFTKSPKTADDVVVLNTMSANDIRDRDLDKFKTSCIRRFAKLPEPLSPVGKPFMVSHDTTKLPIGRIFDAGTKRNGDNLFLTNKVYVPKTEQYSAYLENVDFGVYWAVSVGVMLGSSECTVGKSHPFQGRYWCTQGHEKGLSYDPDSTEKDDWGWPLPVADGAAGAVQCGCDFDDPTDFYELSQVYLGAQYFAELGKDPQFENVIKSASVAVPVIGLRSKEAEQLPMRHVPTEVEQSRGAGFKQIGTSDGSYRWKGTDGFIYTWDPDEGDVLCLGKAAVESGELAVKREALEATELKFRDAKLKLITRSVDGEDEDLTDRFKTVGEAIDAMRVQLDAAESDDDVADVNVDDVTADVEELAEEVGDGEPEVETTETGKDAGVPMKKVVQEEAKRVKLPASILDKVAAADDDKAFGVLLAATAEVISGLESTAKVNAPMVAAGTAYLNDLRENVKTAYIRSKQLGDTTKGVNTANIENLIGLAGDNLDLLKSMAEEYEASFEDRLKAGGAPLHAVRSSFPVDANNPERPIPMVAAPEETGRLAIVSRIHGRG